MSGIEIEPEGEQELSPQEQEQRLRDERRQMTIRALRHRAELWVGLEAEDGFKELIAEFRSKKQRMKKQYFESLHLGEPVSQREIDYQRGMLEGLGYLDTLLTASHNLLDKLDLEGIEPEVEEGDDWAWPTS